MLFEMASGPKEGRFRPGLLSSSERRRRYGGRRKHFFLLAAILLMLVVYPALFSLGMLSHLEEYELLPANLQSLNVEAAADGDLSRFALRKETLKSENQAQDDSATNEGVLRTPKHEIPVTREPTTAEPVVEARQEQSPVTKEQDARIQPEAEKENPQANQWAEEPNLKNDIDVLSALLPDELSMREFLRPIDSGGPERMRELGLRTRAYQKYLSAWEKLHMVEDERTGETYIRGNLVLHLRQMQENDDKSSGSSLANTIHKYEVFRGFMVKLSHILFPFTSPYFADHMTLHAQFKNAGRGIVLTAGDDQAQFLLTTIYALRKVGCELPIEIMYLGDDDLDEDHRIELEASLALPGVTTRDVAQMVDDEGWRLAGWAIKSYAILLSSFREVIFIDADSFFFRDPAKLFEEPSYVETGALFFRDRTIMPESKRRWLLKVLPRPIPKLAKESTWWKGTSGHHQESGVVVMDKWRHFVSMLLICRLNGSDRDGRDGKVGVYEMMHGDKETFWIGFLLADDQSFAFHRGAVGVIGVLNTTEAVSAPSSNNDEDLPPLNNLTPLEGGSTPKKYTMCSPQLLHLDLDDSPLWFNGWLLVSKYAKRTERRFAPMKSYLVEPRGGVARARDDESWTPGTQDYWKLGTDNMCCLTSTPESKFDIADEDLALLKMMRDRALEVGAIS
ncbi:glycosyltransferase family 71 protein [Xylaria nigripes]|nr:glycosyltransferase family 71 protein [Xylaria nigripes]